MTSLTAPLDYEILKRGKEIEALLEEVGVVDEVLELLAMHHTPYKWYENHIDKGK